MINYRMDKEKQYKIALLVDNPFRDLPGLVLVAKELASRGAKCFLIPMNLREQEIWPLAPDFVLLNHLRTVYEDFLEDLYSAGISVGVLDTEGSVFSPVTDKESDNLQCEDVKPSMEEHALSMTKREDLRYKVSCYCSWTKEFADYAIDQGWYNQEQMHVTGTPRMDYYAEKWHKVSRLISDYVDEYPEPMILINGSFCLSNPKFKTPEEEAQMMTEEFSYSKDFIDKLMDSQVKALDGLVEIANEIAKNNSDLTVIYRPHPFEAEETYMEKMKNLPNLHLKKEGTVIGWLLRSKALIHFGSSTAIDAALLNVPAFTAKWLPAFPPVPLVDSLSIDCKDLDTLLKNITKAKDEGFSIPRSIISNTKDVIKKTYYKIDGNSHQRVADTILKSIKDKKNKTSNSFCEKKTLGWDKHNISHKITSVIRKILGISPHFSFKTIKHEDRISWWDVSEKQYSLNDIIRQIKIIDEFDGLEKNDFTIGYSKNLDDYSYRFTNGRSVTISLK